MSSVFFVQPVHFGSNPEIVDNTFITCKGVSELQAANDQVAANRLLREMRARLRSDGVDARLICNKDDPRGDVTYAQQGDAIFPNNSISFHNFTDAEGHITRRLVILYPMSKYRQDELPRQQVLEKLQKAAAQGHLELLDLRAHQSEGRCLEGTGAINFSHDGRYAYLSQSRRTDDALFDLVCGEAYLNIPPSNRFVFTSVMPSGDAIYHTNVVGWCGKGICAWALDLMRFADDDAKVRFEEHLAQHYKLVVRLSAEEVEAYAGNALEVAAPTVDGGERRMLFLSATAYGKLSVSSTRELKRWYGTDCIFPFYGEVVERRTGGSIRCLMGASVTHGEVIPSAAEASTLQVAGIEEVEDVKG